MKWCHGLSIMIFMAYRIVNHIGFATHRKILDKSLPSRWQRLHSQLFVKQGALGANNEQKVGRRRKHSNKYSEMSKCKIDPIDVALYRVEHADRMKYVEEIEQKELRGTTVPTREGSNDARKQTTHNDSPPLDMHTLGASPQINIHTVDPADPSTFGFIEVGNIRGPHGIQGEVKIEFETDFVERLLRPSTILYVKNPLRNSPRPICVSRGRRQWNNLFIVQFQSVRSCITAAALKGYTVYIKESDRPTLSKDEYLVRDLVGLECFHHADRHGSPIGVVVSAILPSDMYDKAIADIMHPMLEIQKPLTKNYILIPYVSDIINEVDLVLRRIFIDPPEGLLDLIYQHNHKVIIKGNLPARITRLSEEDRILLEKSCKPVEVLREDKI